MGGWAGVRWGLSGSQGSKGSKSGRYDVGCSSSWKWPVCSDYAACVQVPTKLQKGMVLDTECAAVVHFVCFYM